VQKGLINQKLVKEFHVSLKFEIADLPNILVTKLHIEILKLGERDSITSDFTLYINTYKRDIKSATRQHTVVVMRIIVASYLQNVKSMPSFHF
jgi:hypothetical protein